MRFRFMIVTCILLLSIWVTGCNNEGQPVIASNLSGKEPIHSEIVSSSPNVQKVIFHSESLDKDMKFNIYLPIGYEITQKYPVLYMIHGYDGNENSWVTELE
jgi:enterochelin esterase-like enzyme